MKIFTIGFTKKTAQEFFSILKEAGVNCVVDIRLHPDGQLAGFTKQGDLQYFLRELIDCDYHPIPRLAPTDEILKAYRSGGTWDAYEQAFFELMKSRGVPDVIDKTLFMEKNCCLLCSEPTPEKCHRRLAAELLANAWGDTQIIHL
ncbi:DUF488 family protein [Leptolinea tardivitalis]|uniref:DUF488 domain-containing protein n=1 Tax=Leptolinea tardivitalis TaxID=229920 RepID=A0A0P6XVU4_9CHLR|nr:DUF488 domain-containing protein [Leptolinea tardivitalis]KPL73465.1 hypothetical protein ADM99_04550 [Leptolinea tardivitalis]GAP21630.1 uncharacterized conserved protein [Leptolinea tardivitalis]